MLFREFEVRDFGVFSGTTLFELAGRPGPGGTPPIVLVGGKNGAGKTTFLEALRLCLYGPLSFPGGTSRREYTEYLRSRIHRTRAETPVLGARLSLSFEHAEAGTRVDYRLVRAWWVKGEGKPVHERFEVFRDGKLMEELASEHWADFVEDLIPVGVSRLFFFDGEQIQSLAADETADADLAKSLKTMLGLDLVERLRADLAHYQVRELKKGSAGEDLRALEEAEGQRLAAEAELAGRVLELNGKDSELKSASAQLAISESDLKARGGRFAAAREELLTRGGALEGEAKQLQVEAKKLLDGPLASSFCPELLARMIRQLELEQQVHSDRLLRERLERIMSAVRERIWVLEPAPVTGVHQELLGIVQEEIGAETGPESDLKIVHDLSNSDVRQIVRWADGGRASATQGRDLARAFGTVDRSRTEVERHLGMAPDDDTLTSAFDGVAAGRAKVLLLEAELAQLVKAERAAEVARDRAQREQDKVTARMKDKVTLQKRLRLAQRSAAALLEYQEVLTSRKVEALERSMETRFGALARKEDLVRRVTIDPQTFQVHLFDAVGRKIPRSDLSAGEKQIYAIAMLWGLADVSGRPLPMIVDTPLGRLDSDHRKNLIENYFPSVSRQVVILSTDTEVDQHLFKSLEPHISHAYLLQTDEARGATTLSEGYFWKGAVA